MFRSLIAKTMNTQAMNIQVISTASPSTSTLASNVPSKKLVGLLTITTLSILAASNCFAHEGSERVEREHHAAASESRSGRDKADRQNESHGSRIGKEHSDRSGREQRGNSHDNDVSEHADETETEHGAETETEHVGGHD